MGETRQTDNLRRKFTASVVNTLASVKFAVVTVVIIAVACVVGTLLPQGTDVAKYLRANPTTAPRMELLETLGLTHVYSSWWFLGLLCVLAASITACSARRFAAVRRTKGYSRGHAFGSMVTHISFLLILAGGVIRGVWGEKGHLEFREGETAAHIALENGFKHLPFLVHLAKFEIETDQPKQAKTDADCDMQAAQRSDCSNCNKLLVRWQDKDVLVSLPIKLDVEQVVAPESETATEGNSFRVKVLRYVPDFVMDSETRQVASRSDVPRNPAILVAVDGPNYQNHRWLFAKFPNFEMHSADTHTTGTSPLEMLYVNHATVDKPSVSGPIKNWHSTLLFVENNEVKESRTIAVNSPFKYKGYTFYQTSWNPEDHSYSALQVVKDPGVPVVYAGFTLMIVGLFVVFYLNPWLNERRKKQ